MTSDNRRAGLAVMVAATLILIGLIELTGTSPRQLWYALPIAMLCLIPSETFFASRPLLRLVRRTIAFAICGAFAFAQLSVCASFVADWINLLYLYWQEPVRSIDGERNLLVSLLILVFPCLLSFCLLRIMWLLWTDSPQLWRRPSQPQRRRALILMLALLVAALLSGAVVWYFKRTAVSL